LRIHSRIHNLIRLQKSPLHGEELEECQSLACKLIAIRPERVDKEVLDAIIELLHVENEQGAVPIRLTHALRAREARNGGEKKPRALLNSAEDLTTKLGIEKSTWKKWPWIDTAFPATTMSDKDTDMEDVGQASASIKSTGSDSAAAAASSNVTDCAEPMERKSNTDRDSKHNDSEYSGIHKSIRNGSLSYPSSANATRRITTDAHG
jgi:hypothetical protein